MKRIPFIILFASVIMFLLPSCSYSMKELSRELAYEDPQTIGGTWTVSFDNGDSYQGVTCLYWGTTDDTSVWKLPDGRKLIQSGTVHAVSEQDGGK